MFFNKLTSFRLNVLRNLLFYQVNRSFNYRQLTAVYKYSDGSSYNFLKLLHNDKRILRHSKIVLNQRRCSNKIIDLNNIFNDKDSITRPIFPQPRVTLNIFGSRRPDKTFDVHYKQPSVAIKGKHKHRGNAEWICTYSFVWPEKIKFECASLSKKQAAEKAATLAIEYLYKNNHIDINGSPVYDRHIISDLKGTLNVPLRARIDENSVERINNIWEQYHDHIKPIYRETHTRALQRVDKVVPILQDSTLDQEEECSDYEINKESLNEINEPKLIHPVYGRSLTPPSESALTRRHKELQETIEDSSEELVKLPIDQYITSIIESLERSRVVIVVGHAGCGKSTRTPRCLLQQYGADATVLVSEPRRVAAIGLAQRVADELMENVGQTVGYQVRLSCNLPAPSGGSILYVTSGVLLRRLLNNPGLIGCSHVIIDEAHERDINTDVILLLLKRALNINSQLKVIIMSATLNTQVFTRYFDNSPVIEVPGRTFPVKMTYLEDLSTKYPKLDTTKTIQRYNHNSDKPHIFCNEIVNLIKAIDKNEQDGGILVFLPGWAEIRTIKNMLQDEFKQSSRHFILPVHSRLTNTEQSKMFSKPLPGVRKIVISTNVAETSVTIPDIVYVIDCGAHRQTRTVPDSGSSSLECVWTSLAAATQRAGRAGRVQPGHCFKMYTREIEEQFVKHNTPEILRVPLDQTALHCRSYAPEQSIQEFLSQLPEPPTSKAIQYAIQDLKDIGALRWDEKLSPLGQLLSRVSLSPRVGRMLLCGAAVLGVGSGSDIVTQLSSQGELFSDAGDRTKEIREIKTKFDPTSDHLALNAILQEFEAILQNKGSDAAERFCRKYGLREDRLLYCKALSTIYLTQLLNLNIIDTSTELNDLNRFSEVGELMKAIILFGSNRILSSKKYLKTRGQMGVIRGLKTSQGERAHISSDSVNYGLNKHSPGAGDLATYYGGYHSVERRALVLHATSLVTPITVLLAAQGQLEQTTSENEDEVILSLSSHDLKIHMPISEAEVILKAREMFWSTFDYYIERDSNSEKIDTNRFRIRLVKAICKILNEAAKETYQVKIKE